MGFEPLGGLSWSLHLTELEIKRRDPPSGGIVLIRALLPFRCEVVAVRYWHWRHIDGLTQFEISKLGRDNAAPDTCRAANEREAC